MSAVPIGPPKASIAIPTWGPNSNKLVALDPTEMCIYLRKSHGPCWSQRDISFIAKSNDQVNHKVKRYMVWRQTLGINRSLPCNGSLFLSLETRTVRHRQCIAKVFKWRRVPRIACVSKGSRTFEKQIGRLIRVQSIEATQSLLSLQMAC